MTRRNRFVTFTVVALVVMALGLYLVRAILLPFLVGMAAAYLLDPIADRLERSGLSRPIATLVIAGGFFLLLIGFVVLPLPALLSQAADLAQDLPGYFERLRQRLAPALGAVLARADVSVDLTAEGLLQNYSEQAISVVASTVTSLLQSSFALLNLVALIFVTPVVTFYLLLDWDRMVASARELIPRPLLGDVDRLAGQVDAVLAGYIRGQGLVCLFLATYYALGLWMVGLRYGLIIGLLTGIFAFIPYLGMGVGLCVGLAVAAFQFQEVGMIALVAAIFASGQVIEGNFITPRLVGDRIRLHPVWLIFAALAGTALFGLIGTFLAVPVAAVLGVLIRFAVGRYRDSHLYDHPREG